MSDERSFKYRIFRFILALLLVVFGSILAIALFSDVGGIFKSLIQGDSFVVTFVASVLIAALGNIIVGYVWERSRRLLVLAIALKMSAYTLAVTPVIVIFLLFYYFNSGNVPTLVQVAANSFLSMFLLLNIIHMLDRGNQR